MAYAGIKMVHYSFFFWLPFYLTEHFLYQPSEASSMSSWYDVGGIFGSTIGGAISDKFKRSPVLTIMLLAAIPMLFIYQGIPNNEAINIIMLIVIGSLIGGVVNIFMATIAADLGQQPQIKDREGLGTVTAILTASGNIGVAIGQIIIPLIQTALGWDSVFDLFIIGVSLNLKKIVDFIFSFFLVCPLHFVHVSNFI